MSLKITLQPNDHLWSPEGFHVLDSKGIAIICQEEIEVEFLSQEILDRVMPIIESRRVEYTVVEPAQEVEPEPEVIQEIQPEDEQIEQ
jgi:hypothetical protein